MSSVLIYEKADGIRGVVEPGGKYDLGPFLKRVSQALIDLCCKASQSSMVFIDVGAFADLSVRLIDRGPN